MKFLPILDPRNLLTVGLLATVAWASTSTPPEELSMMERYWLALNEGRDVSFFDPIAREAMRPEHRAKEDPAFNARREEILQKIEASSLRPDVTGWGDRDQAVVGSDWPTLGGNLAHTGVSADPGPTRGEELWRYPMGYDFYAGVTLRNDVVYAPSPGTETVLIAFDRESGRKLYAVKRPRQRSGLAFRGGGEVIFHEPGVASVIGTGFKGEVADIHLFDPQTGATLGLVGSWATETSYQRDETYTGDPIRAYVGNDLRSIMVKRIQQDRVWWRFWSGPGTNQPLLTSEHVFVSADDGSLWGLNLEGQDRVAWVMRIDSPWRSTPTLANGVLFAGANNGVVYAIEAATGQVRWQTDLNTGEERAQRLFSRVLVDDGRVLVGAADGRLYALAEEDGSLQWSFDTGDWVRSRPFAHGNRVAVANMAGELVGLVIEADGPREAWRTQLAPHPVVGDLAGDGQGILVTNNHARVFAVNWEGDIAWHQRMMPVLETPEKSILADAPPQITQSPPTVANGLVYAGGPFRFLEAIDANSGERVWRFEVNGRIAAAPTVADDTVLVGEYLGGSIFHALDAATGAIKWQADIGGVWASPTAVDGRVYVGTTEGDIKCLDLATGQELWSWATGGGVYPAPAVDEEAIYFGSWDGYYYALERQTGVVRWAFAPPGITYHIGGRPDSPAPVLSHGMMIAPITGGRYVAVDVKTGREVWRWFPPTGICNVTAAVHDGVVYLGTFSETYVQPSGATLFGLDVTTGEQLWTLPSLGGLTSPVFTGAGLMVVGSLNTPYIEGFRVKPAPEKPELVWRLRTEGHMVESLPAVSGGLGFFLSCDGWLRAIW